MSIMDSLSKADAQVCKAIEDELNRQRTKLELIASENIVSRAVMEAQGSVLTNKYAEGYPGKRYYGGCEYVDVAEQLAIDRAKELFGANWANVQPHSGAQANMAVFFALLQPGDTILGMNLTDGGHLTHGSPVNISGTYYKVIPYGVDKETERIDYDALERLANEQKPKMIIAGASAYARTIDFERIGAIAKAVGAIFLVDMAHIAGLVAAGQHPNPVPHADIVTSTTHKTLRGPRGGLILSMGKVTSPLKKPAKTLENIPTLIDRSVFPGMQGGPHMNTVAAKAVAFGEALQPEFCDYAKNIVANAAQLAEELQKRGFQLVAGGTSNHLILADINKSFGIDGKTAEIAIDKIGLTLNANAVPDDPLPMFRPSGIRLGTPAITTRGCQPDDMAQIAEWIKQAIDAREDEEKLGVLREEVREFCRALQLSSV